MEKPPTDPADHAEDFAYRYEFPLDQYCAIRMAELGIPEHLHGATDFDGDGRWKAFIVHERVGGRITDGISVNSGCLNPELLKGLPGVRVFAKARLRDRIDAIIAHEYEEDRLGTHELALKHAPKTELPISDGARSLSEYYSVIPDIPWFRSVLAVSAKTQTDARTGPLNSL